MLSRVFERFLHCTRVFTVCCAIARRHLCEDGLSELVPYPRARSLHCPAFSPDVCGARFGLHVVCSRRSFLLCTKRGCCKVSSHGFGVFSRTQMTPAKQPNTTSFCLSACLWSRAFSNIACFHPLMSLPEITAWQQGWQWRSTHRLSCRGQRSQTFRGIRIHSSVGPIQESVH